MDSKGPERKSDKKVAVVESVFSVDIRPEASPGS